MVDPLIRWAPTASSFIEYTAPIRAALGALFESMGVSRVSPVIARRTSRFARAT